jgi:hypothetical protein
VSIDANWKNRIVNSEATHSQADTQHAAIFLVTIYNARQQQTDPDNRSNDLTPPPTLVYVNPGHWDSENAVRLIQPAQGNFAIQKQTMVSWMVGHSR